MIVYQCQEERDSPHVELAPEAIRCMGSDELNGDGSDEEHGAP